MRIMIFIMISICPFMTYAAGTDQNGTDRQKEFTESGLNPDQIDSIRHISQAVLVVRRQARESEQAEPARQALKDFRESLIEYRNDLMTVHPPGEITISGGTSRINVVPSSTNNAAWDQRRKQSFDRLTSKLALLKQRGDDRAQNSGTIHQNKHAQTAIRRSDRIAAMQSQLQDIHGKAPAEQLAAINMLIEQTDLKHVRELKPIAATTPTQTTPTISIKTRHRH